MVNKYDLIVIGGGSGGLTAAIGGAQIGASVLLVEKERIGGDCTHFGCVPSKALIKLSKDLAIVKKYNPEFKINIKKILEKVSKKVDFVYSHETPIKIKEMGVDVVIGSAEFISKNQIRVGDQNYIGSKFVIATGARARIPKISGIENSGFLTNKEIFKPNEFKSLTIIGGGPIGCELGQAFSNLGIKVTIVIRGENILSKEDEKARKFVECTFEKEGIIILKNQIFEKIERTKKGKKLYLKSSKTGVEKILISDEILISVGRIANIENLGLEKAEIETNNRGIIINDKTQTTNKNIFAVGDVAGGFEFTHFANHQGKIALANIIFKLPFKYEQKVMPKVTFTNPQVASIGVSDNQLQQMNQIQGKDFFVLEKDFNQIDRAITDDNTHGFFKIICSKKGLILGATLVGEGSGELICEIALAMKNKIKITKLADTIHPYPTYGYGLRNCADQFRGLNFTEKKKRLIKKIFGLNGK